MKFHPTPVPNLLRAETGTYYARIVHLGKQHWRSLKTAKLRVAREKLRVVDEEIRGRKVARGVEMTWQRAAEIYAAEVAGMDIEEASKKSRLQAAATIRRVDPGWEARDVEQITTSDCRGVLNNLGGFIPPGAKTPRRGDSPTNYNRVLRYLAGVLNVAVREGYISKNPTTEIAPRSPRKKLLVLPSKTQFARIIEHIRALPISGPDSANFVEGLTYTGARVRELAVIEWSEVDWARSQVAIGGSKTKNARRWLPMNPALQELLTRMRSPGASGFVFNRRDCLTSLKNACKSIGTKAMTHHDLRHLFATACIESGVDVPTVARWMGHGDGGALAMRTYGHLREQHSTAAAAKVAF